MAGCFRLQPLIFMPESWSMYMFDSLTNIMQTPVVLQSSWSASPNAVTCTRWKLSCTYIYIYIYVFPRAGQLRLPELPCAHSLESVPQFLFDPLKQSAPYKKRQISRLQKHRSAILVYNFWRYF